jgi:hypothetical protein
MGVTSIIAILIILVLIVFSALSITTARVDLGLSEKSAGSISAWYKADAEAEERLAEVVSAVRSGNVNSLSSGYTIKKVDGSVQVGYNVPVDHGRALKVELFVTDDGKVTRSLWQVVTIADWTPDTSIHLYQ